MEAAGEEYLSEDKQKASDALAEKWKLARQIDWCEAAEFITQEKEIPDAEVQTNQEQEIERQRQVVGMNRMREPGEEG